MRRNVTLARFRVLLRQCLHALGGVLATTGYAYASSIATAPDWLKQYGLQILLSALLLQLLFIIWLLHRIRLPDETSQNDPILQKTKYQLRREIVRHEATEELLLETREYLNGLINSLPSVVIGVTETGHVTHWNIAAEQASGLSNTQALGKKISTVFTTPPIPTRHLDNTILSGTSYKEEAIPIGHGTDTSYCDLIIQPLISPETPGAVILVSDVTLRVRVERSMIQNEKMLSLGKMAAGLAHEINNPLAAILSNTQTIERRLTSSLSPNIESAETFNLNFSSLQRYLESREIPTFLQNIQNAGSRAAQIVMTMLEFSHAYQSKFERHDIISIVDKSLELAANTIGLKSSHNITMPFVIRDFNSTIPLVACATSEIQQVLLNLLLNAAQAIHYADPPIDNPTIIVRLTQKEGNVIIEVQDNGPGMKENVQKHIFEPFFTTKEVGTGTGLGLSVSYFIIREHHRGNIEVRSKAGHGTNFSITLPIDQLPHSDNKPSSSPNPFLT